MMIRAAAIARNRRTKIVATLGPASTDPAVIEALMRAGVDIFRLNFSHGAHEDHAARLATIRGLETRLRRPVGVLADIQGPKLRCGTFTGGYAHLERGRAFRLDLRDLPGDRDRVRLPHPEILSAAMPGMRLLLDDGKIRLRVVRVATDHLETEVLVGGKLSDRKGVNVPDVVLPIPALTPKDRVDLAFALDAGVDLIGLSFVQTVADVEDARAIIGDRAWIVSKIEKPQAVADLPAIVAASDAIMVARGDLGVELPPEDVPMVQKRIVALSADAGRPVIVATQMLESMIDAPAPTRAEASDVATAVFDGADAVMLSAETAAGRYPLEAVEIMNRILARAEQAPDWQAVRITARDRRDHTRGDAIPAAAGRIAQTINARAIVAHTHSGATALRIARERPATPILAVTPFAAIARRLMLAWGLEPRVLPPIGSMTDAVSQAGLLARREKVAGVGDDIVVTAGMPFGRSGTTNSLRIASVEIAKD